MSNLNTTPGGGSQVTMARVGKYLMLDLLGEGAFGKVRLAVEENTGREYAMKIMDKSHIKANELTLQVRREIAVMKAMSHPNIVNLHEVLTSSKNLYMVMDLVTGGELFDAVATEGKLPEDRTRSYFQQLVDGVDYCHSRRVYHRDLKPENLLLSGDKETLKITDFGLSSIKSQNASSELLHTIMGSPHYIAPEIITSAANGYEGSKVDVWAAGVILFGMLAGFLPFDEPTTRDLYRAIVHSPIKYPPHFSYDVIKLLRAMLQKDPIKRPTMSRVKEYAWFKVNYDPAVITEPKLSSFETLGPRKKSKNRPKRQGDRSHKKKPKDRSRISQGSVKEGTNSDNTSSNVQNACAEIQNANLRGPNNIESKNICELLADSSASGSNSAGLKSEVQETMTFKDSVKIVCDQENVDPVTGKEVVAREEKQHVQRTPEKNLSLHAPLRPLSRPSPNPKQTAQPEADPRNTNPQTPQLAQIAKLGESTPEKTSVDALGKLSPDASCTVHVTSASVITRDTEQTTPHSGTFPGMSDIVNPLSTPKRTFAARDSKDVNCITILSSPLSPEASRFSSTNSSIRSTSEERQRESLRRDAANKAPNIPLNSLFESPISLKSTISFSSPGDSKSRAAILSSNYRSLVPKLFACQSGEQDDLQQQESSGSHISEFSPQNVTSDKECISLAVDEAEDAGEDEGIFKPVKSLFAPLIKQALEKKEFRSMSANALCPEFDYETDGGPQWCLDSTEVFADVEDDEQYPQTAKGTTTEILQVLMKEQHGATKVEEDKPQSSSIFAPLNDHLACTLSPASEREVAAALYRATQDIADNKPFL